MKKVSLFLACSIVLLAFAGCSHPQKRLKNINLGMTPDEVEDEMGRPYAVRAAKIFEDETTTMIWEYHPPVFSPNDKLVQIYYENGRVVQWGLPGDYNTGSEEKAKEYQEKEVIKLS